MSTNPFERGKHWGRDFNERRANFDPFMWLAGFERES